MCECDIFNDYTDDSHYQPGFRVYPQSYPQKVLLENSNCGNLDLEEARLSGITPSRVEIAEVSDLLEVRHLQGMLFRDPGFRAYYAPFIPEIRAREACGR